ncbi:hypothetical protein M426DRAFT_265384 [Hypoxylon sp. CI-4A]|nr:hypothetical protein M426DRAFT_265384 [Hypoxylon sp. CI-4A]
MLSKPTRVVLGLGPDSGSLVFDLAGIADPGIVLHRASLLREILKPLPKEILHAHKGLSGIRCLGDELEVVFKMLLLEPGDLKAYSQWEHKSTPSYARGPVCVLGDAAHATSPWRGSGAGLAIEDAVILGHLLSHCKTKGGLEAAFKAYYAVRRPREPGDRPGSRQAEMARTWKMGLHLFLDIHQHKQEALNAMQVILQTNAK